MNRKWLTIIVLASAQFVMVLDTTVMNVAISNVVADLNTTVTQVQMAITLYTLVMAALMLTGGKLGDIFGRRNAFALGIAIYGCGSAITGLAGNINVLLFGWSLLEGIGAALVIPAIASLVAHNYPESRDRAMAYGIVGAIAAVGVAAGPLIGGWVTEYASWRYVFFGEVVAVGGILAARKLVGDVPRVEQRPSLDFGGAALSMIGMGLIVFALLRIPQWGLIQPSGSLTVAGQSITPFGFSVVPFMVAAGLFVLKALMSHCRRRESRDREPLMHPRLLGIAQLRGGLSMLASQQLILNGIFFVLPLYLQIVLGRNAIETGLALTPISVTMLLGALGGPRLGARLGPRMTVRLGLGAMLVAAAGLMASVGYEMRGVAFSVALAAFGLGVGLLASQLGNVIMSAVESDSGSEAGGLQGTAQNLGASLGTALIGAVLLTGLSGATVSAVQQNPQISASVKEQVAIVAESGLEFVPREDVRTAAIDAGLPESEAAELMNDYGDAQLRALKQALLAAVLFVLAGLWIAGGLPTKRIE
ncbi:MAG: MFS transporter [Actinobacteria bacterium]|nr:MFS transporter [Actinomycetota bacterium]